MLKRFYSFIVVFLLMFSGELYAQQDMGLEISTNGFKSINNKMILSFTPKFSKAKFIKDPEHTNAPEFILLNLVPASFSSSQFGFFCQKELQLEKVIAIPVRFRLGSLEYVNWMEQKPNALKPIR